MLRNSRNEIKLLLHLLKRLKHNSSNLLKQTIADGDETEEEKKMIFSLVPAVTPFCGGGGG